MKKFKTNLYSGIITLLPIIITIYILHWIFQILLNGLRRFFVTVGIKKLILQTGIGKEQDLHIYIEILVNLLSLVFILAILFLVGLAMRVFLFKKIGQIINNILSRIPLFKQIYTTIAQILSLVFSEKNKTYQKVVMLEYPRKGIYSIGFMTSEENKFIERYTNEKMCNVFIPTSPNPTSGMFVCVKAEEIKILDIKIDDAVKLIISGGVVLPAEGNKNEEI